MQNKKFSQALHDWRKKKQLTQEDVANKLGVSRTIVSFLETGKQLPQIHHLNLLKEKFNLDLSSHVWDSADQDKPYFGPPNEKDSSISAMAELINGQKEAKRDLVVAMDMTKALYADLEDKDTAYAKTLMVIYQTIKQAFRNL